MDRIIILVFLMLIVGSIKGQYFQQNVNYNIKTEIDAAQRLVTATCIIDYHNNSPDRLDTLYFHLWANAFSSKNSSFARQALRSQNVNFHFASPDEMGGYKEIKLRSKGSFHLDKDNPDMAFLVLDTPLHPNESRLLEFEYILKIPKLFSRLGINASGDIHLVHWFPKPAVYDIKGWHWFPYLSQGEFYSEYGTYNITLNHVDQYNIGHTGTKLDMVAADKIHLLAANVFDFAIFLVKKGELRRKSVKSISGKNVELQVLSDPDNSLWEQSSMQYLEESFHFFEKEVGPFNYPKLALVDGKKRQNSGMEYPMLIEVSAGSEAHLRYYINHEVGHQWFYSQLGFNEREEPFLDEGLTTFFEHQYTQSKINSEHHTSLLSPWSRNSLEMPLLQYIYIIQKRRGFSESPSEEPEKTSLINYGLNAYERAAYVYRYVQAYVGKEIFRIAIKAFYNKWQGRHPSLGNLVEELSDQSGKDLSWIYNLLATDATVDFAITRKNDVFRIHNKGNTGLPVEVKTDDTTFWTDILPPGSDQSVRLPSDNASVNEEFLGLEKYAEDNHTRAPTHTFILGLSMDHSTKKEMYYLPAVRYNYADGLGLGMTLYNSSIVPKKLQYLIDPQYGFRSKSVIGNAWLAYNIFPDHSPFRKVQTKISLKKYSDFNSEELKVNLDYIRLTPQISFHFKDDPASLTYRKLTFESIHLRTEELDFSSQNEFEVDGSWNHFFRARFDYFNFKAINRVEYWSEIEYHSYDTPSEVNQNYLKLTGAFHYRTPFAIGRNINIRLFGSGFITNSQRESSSFNNAITKGSIALLYQAKNDYTRGQYFLNRQQDGPLTNQIGNGGGGFKDAPGSAYNIGMSNDWAVSANFNMDLPIRLPAFLKLKPYFDLGYFRTKSTSSDPLRGEVLMSGGMMLSYLDGGLEVYFPLYANNPIQNIYDIENEGIFKKISFKIDLHRLNPWDLIDDLNL